MNLEGEGSSTHIKKKKKLSIYIYFLYEENHGSNPTPSLITIELAKSVVIVNLFDHISHISSTYLIFGISEQST